MEYMLAQSAIVSGCESVAKLNVTVTINKPTNNFIK
jgi:hypothetical protein